MHMYYVNTNKTEKANVIFGRHSEIILERNSIQVKYDGLYFVIESEKMENADQILYVFEYPI